MTENPIYVEAEDAVRDLGKEAAWRMKAKEELNTVRSALDSAASGVIVTDRSGRINYVNSALLRMFEYPSEKEVIEKHVTELLAASHRFSDIEAIIDRARGDTEEFEALRKDGTPFHVEVSTSSIADSDGHEVGRIASFVDITDRKRLEQTLKSRSDEIKLFAYSVSHDLKSPAIALHGLTKRLYRNYSDALDEKGREYCGQILRCAEQIAALVEQINVFISTREAPLILEIFKLKEILQAIKEEFSTSLTLRRIRWLEHNDNPEIKADRLSFIRLFRNLLDNALKYGGESLSEIRIGYSRSDAAHIFSVKDNGIGLKGQNSHQDIFAPFVRSKTSKGIQGSGLGLNIVKQIAEKHGGQVWLEPGQERGITFYVSIPKHIQAAPSDGAGNVVMRNHSIEASR